MAVDSRWIARLGWIAMMAAPGAEAHPQPTSLVMLDVGETRITGELHIPLNELELAFGHAVTREPDKRLAEWEHALRLYLVEHIRPVSKTGAAWTVKVGGMTLERAEQAKTGPFQEVIAALELQPPGGASVRNFILHYDVILHQVVTHRALVSVRSDWAGGQTEAAQAGVIAVNTGTGRVDPLPIDRGAGSAWDGFLAMIRLGARHIREGTDHLLFLIVLLLPATLKVNGGRWSGPATTRESLWGVVKIVTAFTLGHSVTLLAGALGWVSLPPQPVEILIAGSILVTAVHAIHPLFPGREGMVAAGFGLIHGLAFATVLTEMKLTGAPLIFSILSFNLGIELLQMVVIGLTMPWFIMLSTTPAHQWVRVGGALLAAMAAAGWLLNRVTGESNVVERLMTQLTDVAPAGIFVLALIAIPAYAWSLRGRAAERGIQ